MIKSRRLFVSIIIIITILTCVFFIAQGETTTTISAKNGVLNLEKLNWSESGIIKLNGEWNYYPSLLLEGIDSHKTSFIKTIPHFWEADPDQNYSPYGFGTYKLQVTGLKPSGIYGLEILDEVTAYKLYANNVLVASNGIVSKEQSTYFPQWNPLQGVFQANENGNVEFAMEIANFDYYRGGFWNSIKVGNTEDIYKDFTNGKIMDMFLFTSIFIVGVLNFILFLLYRKYNYTILFFALFCFCMSIRTLLIGKRLISDVIPSLNWYILIRLEYLMGYLLLPLFGLFFIHLFNNYVFKKIQKFLFVFIIIFSLAITLFMPNHMFTAFLTPYKWVSIIFILYFTYFIVKSIILKHQSAQIMLFAVIGIVVAVVKEVFMGGSISWMPFATLNFIICFSLITFQQISSVIQENKTLGTKIILDPLTGLYNRTFIFEKYKLFKYNNQKKFLMFLDLDNFKVINDTYGHKIGDCILEETGKRLKSLLRSTDIICRYGGDEFIIIFDGQLEDIKRIADRIIYTIKQPFQIDENVYNISISIGISEIDTSTKNMETVIRFSDEAMYKAKRNGGSQYYIWQGKSMGA